MPEVTALDRVHGRLARPHGFTSARLRWWVEYACRDDYGTPLAQTSAWAGLFYFAARAPAGRRAQPLLTWPEGNGRVVARYLPATACEARPPAALGRPSFDVSAGRQRVDVTASTRGQRRDRLSRATHVIFAAPQFMTRHLLRPYREQRPAHLAEFDYGRGWWPTCHLNGSAARPRLPAAWDNVLYDSPSLGYVVATHQRGARPGPTVFTYYYPLCDDDPRVPARGCCGLAGSLRRRGADRPGPQPHPDLRAWSSGWT